MSYVRGSIFLILSIISTMILLGPATSAEPSPERQLSISPLRTELVVEAGTSKTGSITLYNTGKQALDIQMNTQLFTVTDMTYEYNFKENSTLNQWVRYEPANFALDAGASKVITYSMNVPITADPSDKYFTMFASTAPSKSSSIISTTERVGSIIYLTVPGNISRLGKLISVRSPLITTDDTSWGATIQNAGSTHFRSNYIVDLQTLWGGTLTHQEDSSLILANSVRLISNELKMPQWLGIYKVAYSFELGDQPTARETHVLVYLPLTQALPLLVLLVIAGLTVRNLYKKHHINKKTSSLSAE